MKKLSKKISLCLALLCCALPGIVFASCSQVSEPMTAEAIFNRIKPAGDVVVEGGTAKPKSVSPAQPLTAKDIEARYKTSCAVCHDAGVAGAPKFRNTQDWSSRITVGVDALLQSAIKGKGAMPPKGTCMQCSDEELRQVIEYMLPK